MFLPSVSVKLPAAGNLAFISEGNDIEWNEQGFPPQIQRAALTTVYAVAKTSLIREATPSSAANWDRNTTA